MIQKEMIMNRCSTEDFSGGGTIPHDPVIEERVYTSVKAHRVYTARSDLSCEVWAWGIIVSE